MDSPQQETHAADVQHEEALHRIRHSLAHVMAQAVLQVRPGAKLGFGPAIDDGFYYDFILPTPITEDDFPEIEKRMKHIVRQGQKFEREDLPRAEAVARLDEMKEPYKREYAEELFDKKGIDSLSFYKNGPFLDMCEGPHVGNTREIPVDAFKLRSVAGAYWRGNSDNMMMTRIYAWAFSKKEELDLRVKAYQEAAARDHKKLGKELDIFVIDDEVGKGLPLWLPNGTVLRDELEGLMRELEFEGNYQRVVTPHLAKVDLYYKTGHLPYYAEHMFPFMMTTEHKQEAVAAHDAEAAEARPADEGGGHERHVHAEVAANEVRADERQAYALRPMNCPHHHKIFSARRRSYRELPLRLAEYGQVYRYEDSGAVSGLLRVRGMAMNDAHIYCTKEQIASEFAAVLEMHRRVYEILGLTEYTVRFSTRDDRAAHAKQKFVDNPAAWDESERIVHQVLLDSGMKFSEGKGEAAFYGPKIDFQFRTVLGREETASTVQLDFAIPERMDLKYIGADNQEHRPYIIHRAPAGTHERFVAFLIERYAGAFPTWLAPVQARVVTVHERFDEYAASVVKRLRARRIRAEIDDTQETFNKKIRNAALRKIPNVLVIGEREMTDGAVTLRRHGVKEQQSLSLAELDAYLDAAIKNRTIG